ncbi:sn-glycerol-3-phosphate ABC transporter ATP-binding protein UgpC [Vibrio sp. Isolate22]|jgi:multiple sugar transport system ATP-binding protein|uniref:Sugar ABC transporter ATPase n=4 Tax=Vibrio TaxID=662 RepID=A0A066UXF9_9VIBR|nr:MULTISPECIES: sn-glycerol-3-phosphate ABC transporter ATP-binding protein UgpC [Vibrio]KAB0286516.1 sn-glycerol-3-phosphate ABC transporter ATP-binding protein UgpC [Vibrio fortis]KDN30557.1 sugar ABC transporter ATPase [Vibrio fortis]MCG9632928.1 sn-glycerol-3-phosphate ABC transporter ATP-binding protein UgpC [Vibrio sp. Isolate30]MCG9693295.1 sn-glycerol-3-phosphate ABC transporter ATP-binding protein UgpC [Vibrio sp. Isolate22]MDK9764359.1 sn-glycerol-3-phosphate ABC transporter ATP-bin
MATLDLKQIRKTYRNADNETLKGIDISIDSGEFLILVGPSGCGKSTLMNTIAGLENISSGEIVIDGVDVAQVEPKDRDIAMVFQSYALYPNMTVRGNIAFGLKIRKMPQDEIDAEVNRVAEMLQIEQLLDRKPSQLSGGQRQRVAMGRALARRPKLYLFDEPLSNLDAKLRVEMRHQIKRLHQKLNTTIVYVTHDQIEAMTLADRIAVMKDGELQQLGTPQEIYTKPSNMFVAGFMGSPSMNFIKTMVDLDEEQNPIIKVIGTADQEHHIRLPQSMREQDGKEVVIGLRPEHITEQQGDDLSATTKLDLQLEVLEPTGPDTIAMVKVNDQEVACRLSPEFEVSVGQMAPLHFDLSKAVFFDAQTERRIDF